MSVVMKMVADEMDVLFVCCDATTPKTGSLCLQDAGTNWATIWLQLRSSAIAGMP
jgi:hypothetical protein